MDERTLQGKPAGLRVYAVGCKDFLKKVKEMLGEELVAAEFIRKHDWVMYPERTLSPCLADLHLITCNR